MAINPSNLYLNTGGGSSDVVLFNFLVRFGNSEISLPGRLFSTLNLAYERPLILVRRFLVKQTLDFAYV